MLLIFTQRLKPIQTYSTVPSISFWQDLTFIKKMISGLFCVEIELAAVSLQMWANFAIAMFPLKKKSNKNRS